MSKLMTEQHRPIDPEKIKNYRDLKYEDLLDKGGKKLYLTGQQCYGKKRKELLIDDDYVLTDDNGRYIDTKNALSRDYLFGLTQEQVQGSKNPSHIYLPMPRAEAEFKKLKPMSDNNNVGGLVNKKEQ